MSRRVKKSENLKKDMARYVGLLLAPAEGFGLWARFFLPFGQKREIFMMFWPIFGDSP